MRATARRHEAHERPEPGSILERGARSPVLRLVTAICMAVVVLWMLFLARQALLTIYVSIVLAIGFSPLVRFIEHQRLRPIGARVPRWAAILSIYLFIVGVVSGTAMALLPVIVTQARELANQLPQLLDRAQQFLLAQGLVPPEMTVAAIVQQLPGKSAVASTILLTTFDLLGGVFGVVAILGLTYYLLVESGSLFETLLRFFPRRQRPMMRVMAAEITAKVSSWLAMQVMLGVIIGISTATALWLLGMPYVYLLALIAGLGELIPFVGPILAAVPGIAIAGTLSWQLAIATGAFYLLQQQFENHILVPRLMGDRVGLSAALVIIALLLGGSLLGILGIILAIPTAAIIQVVLQHALADR